MVNLFKKAVVFTDIHFGLKNNSHVHNQDCLDFVEWMISIAKIEGCDTCLFLGDWHHYRATLNIATLSYSLRAMEKISAAFSQTYFIPGNHDLYYRKKRDIQSVEWARNIPNITIVNDFFNEGDVSIVPWLIDDDYKQLKNISCEYMFGHFELPNFFMNSMIRMPSVSELKADKLSHIGHVFSGHFHKRQTQRNITYIGNAFPHDYADVWDEDRGIMMLEWGEEPCFMSWPYAPTYGKLLLSQLLSQPEDILRDKMHLRVDVDIEITFEDSSFIKESFLEQYELRELAFNSMDEVDHMQEVQGEINFQSVDSIVESQIKAIDSETYDTGLLLNIYGNL